MLSSGKGMAVVTAIILAFIGIIIAIQLINPLATAVVDVSGLAILGSFGGASALIDLLVIITVAAVIIAAVEVMFRVSGRGSAVGAVARRVRRK